MKFFFNFILVLLLSFMAGCTSAKVQQYNVYGPEEFVYESQVISKVGSSAIKCMQGATLEPLTEEALEEYEDAIAEDDILNIVVYHPTRVDLVDSIQNVNERVGGFRVTDGHVYLPCISSVYVLNLTLREAREVIKNQFEKEVKDVDVFVSYKNRLSHRVELAGLVSIPHYQIDGRSRLYEVLAAARLAPHANLFTSYVLRQGHPLDVNLYKLLNQGDMTQNIVMKPGDKIYIGAPQDQSILVMGEVPIQRPIPAIYGFVSLKEALTLAGGIPYTADKRHIQIIRGSLERPKIYVVSWNFMIHQRNEDLLLIPGDLVYVSSTLITDWGRFIGQLQLNNMLITVQFGRQLYYDFK
jgi:polysaccharide biosynthesis/export protein